MITYVKNNEIDREKWDDCISMIPGVKPYGFSWYMDNMVSGWAALIDDDYKSVFPIPGFKRFGIHYIATPPFLQQLGVFTPDKPPREALNEFLGYIPEFYRLIDLCVGHGTDSSDYRITEKPNYELNLSPPYSILYDNFSHHCKRNIERSAREKPELTIDVTPGELIELFINNRGSEIKGIKVRAYKRLQNLMNYCLDLKKGRIVGVRTKGKKLVYGLFLIEVKGNITLLFVVNTPESRERRTGYFVVNELIKESAGTCTILDFEGSSIPTVASFMESFGTVNVPYYRIYSNRLFWPLKMFR
ncbi:MAG: hypothetical protein JXN62_06340 [Bacteroidales bacterium]|nr:hypothetical protein [Bacteroidales bacterium]